MTSYERLAQNMTKAGISSATVATAHRLAMRAWRGEAMTDKEAGLAAAWEAHECAEPWHPEIARQKGNG